MVDLEIDVCYSNNKAGTYVQFQLPVNCSELQELSVYDKLLQAGIKKNFSELFDEFKMDFSTESSYIVNENGKDNLIICVVGKTNEELEKFLAKKGICKKEF